MIASNKLIFVSSFLSRFIIIMNRNFRKYTFKHIITLWSMGWKTEVELAGKNEFYIFLALHVRMSRTIINWQHNLFFGSCQFGIRLGQHYYKKSGSHYFHTELVIYFLVEFLKKRDFFRSISSFQYLVSLSFGNTVVS